MSDRDESEHFAKKRFRACDQCRRRKVRCDGSEAEGTSCSTCVTFKSKCTYAVTTEGRKRRYVDGEYVRVLESEVTRLRLMVWQLRSRLAEMEKSQAASAFSPGNTTYSLSIQPPSAADTPVKRGKDGEDEELAEGFKYMSVDEKRVRFMGKSSNFPLIKAAMKMKQELANDIGSLSLDEGYSPIMLANRRSEFWLCITDFVPPELPYTDFPEPPLMHDLLDNYFQDIHRNFPLLHRPTFLQNIASGLHLTDEGFGATVLLVCALSARFSNNHAALTPGLASWQWAGWQWFQQVRAVRKLIPLTTTTLYDLQVATLTAEYTATLAVPQSNYAIIGCGLRLAQDLGAHRRMAYEREPTVEGELKKRAFWCLLAMERGMCSFLGRPCSVQDEDFDVDYPIECDDEYWVTDGPQSVFKQPVGQPSTVAHFNCTLRLDRIHAHALRTIYSLPGAKSLSDPERAQQIVAELDSELNQWVDSIPEHLKYDLNREDAPFASQSASLYASYYNLRIFIHRPFIMTPRRRVPLPFPSLAICTNAARSYIQVLDRLFALSGPALIFQNHLVSLFSSAIILLLHVWSETRSGSATDVAQELECVHKALRMFKDLEERWNVAGRSWDIIYNLMTAVEAAQNSRARGAPEYRRDDDPRTAVNPSNYPQDSYNYAPPPRIDGAGGSSEAIGSDSFWQDPPTQQETGGQAQFGSPSPLSSAYTPSPNPDLEAIFADLLPTLSHEDPFAAMAHGLPQYFASGQLFESVGPAGVEGSEGQPYVHSGSFMDAQFVGTGMPSVWESGAQGSSL
ncbi:uncharacterized protein PHACADRAFT_140787 [Phanerochaete carnosa HHB-10118-sp]|uniref:Zn(2)-C6 fungal-type domain-containing protein n=1 Tax=Phanerochaete carnosa (strain HHB-10118-sp) TaxID=650164 RepID=K5WHX1_PHACS|nr:uncharacterized protein PHACADRAFT_140787 [Phanerochaete carnosa HHB-10118-sp]EKM58719.1 hypothetical protein PHACADRAFT_140787 [Phanerochaete carnosa HHB-10118-sp]